MENKTTTELLDLLWKIESKAQVSDDEWEKHSQALTDLKKRTPFRQILGESEYEGDTPTHSEHLEEIDADIRLLKRHKHDTHTGDVMTRI